MAVSNEVRDASAIGWRKYTVGFAALQTAGLTNTATLITLPAKTVVHACKMNVTQLFSGTAIATITIAIGIGGTVAKYLVATTAAVTGVTDGVALTVPSLESMSATTDVIATAVAVGANLSVLSQGSVDIYLWTSTLP